MRVQLHRFEDLAKPAPRRELPDPARRAFLATATSLAAVTAMAPEAFARNFGAARPRSAIPTPTSSSLDKRFKSKLGNTPIQRLHTGTLWAEGPAWSGVGRYLLWSDIPNDENLR